MPAAASPSRSVPASCTCQSSASSASAHVAADLGLVLEDDGGGCGHAGSVVARLGRIAPGQRHGELRPAAHRIGCADLAAMGGIHHRLADRVAESHARRGGLGLAAGELVEPGLLAALERCRQAGLARRLEAGDPVNDHSLLAAIGEGAVLRVRPKAMTVAMVTAGLLPIMWGSGPGSGVMTRIADPICRDSVPPCAGSSTSTSPPTPPSREVELLQPQLHDLHQPFIAGAVDGAALGAPALEVLISALRESGFRGSRPPLDAGSSPGVFLESGGLDGGSFPGVFLESVGLDAAGNS